VERLRRPEEKITRVYKRAQLFIEQSITNITPFVGDVWLGDGCTEKECERLLWEVTSGTIHTTLKPEKKKTNEVWESNTLY